MDRHTCTSASLHPRGRSDDRRCADGPALHAADVVLLDNRHELRGGREGAVQLSILFLADFCNSAWLTSIVFCASNGCRPLLIASATFFPVGIVHGVSVWFGGW
jgi:hypothetical protein